MYLFLMMRRNFKGQLDISNKFLVFCPAKRLHHPALRQILRMITRWIQWMLCPNQRGLLIQKTNRLCPVNLVSDRKEMDRIRVFNFPLDFHFMNPVVISGAYIDLELLQHKSWIDVSFIDLWLLDMWRTMSPPRFRYLPTFFIPPVGHAEVTREEIDHFRSFFPSLPPADMPCPYENVVHVLNTGPESDKSGNHFCVLLMSTF